MLPAAVIIFIVRGVAQFFVPCVAVRIEGVGHDSVHLTSVFSILTSDDKRGLATPRLVLASHLLPRWKQTRYGRSKSTYSGNLQDQPHQRKLYESNFSNPSRKIHFDRFLVVLANHNQPKTKDKKIRRYGIYRIAKHSGTACEFSPKFAGWKKLRTTFSLVTY